MDNYRLSLYLLIMKYNNNYKYYNTYYCLSIEKFRETFKVLKCLIDVFNP